MSPITLSNIEANHLGLFILPGEDEKAYRARLDALLQHVSFDATAHKGARCLVQELFDIDPIWVPIYYAKKGLYPWEAACTWYDAIPSIQLQPALETKTHLLGMYSKDEILAHEYVHACRAPLESNVYEEFFAYLVSMHTAKGYRRIFSAIRCFLGPLFSTPFEALVFMLVSFAASTLAGILAFVCMFFAEPSYFLWGLFFVVALSFLALSLFCFCRLLVRWWRWMCCYRKLQAKKIAALKCMIRLTDSEIDEIALMDNERFSAWCKEKAQSEFRWRHLLS